jgi:hypothetical protein
MNIPARKTFAAITNAVNDVVYGVGIKDAMAIGLAALKVNGLWYVVCDYKQGDKVMVALFDSTTADEFISVSEFAAKAGN